MNNVEQYFDNQKQNKEFIVSYNAISEQVDIELELERVKKHIEEDYSKNIILDELSKIQNYLYQATWAPQAIAPS
ncbi:MAG: hypothetical protein DRG11_00470 [Epsilonproteobacteria bacterium]|nr:MAG: hypothetical protein DRG11_00470 [Campylobacterota bacterium]